MRVMTYNIKSGLYHPDGLEAVARVIEAQSPDILGLQEVDEGMARSNGVAQTDWLTRRLRMRGVFAPAMNYDSGLYGIALLSRWPIERHERRLLYRPTYLDAASRPRHDSEQRVMVGAVVTPTPGPSHPALNPAHALHPAGQAGQAVRKSNEPVRKSPFGGYIPPMRYIPQGRQGRQGRGVPFPPLGAVPEGGRAGDGGTPTLKLIVAHLGLTADQRAIQIQELVDFARSWHGELPTIILGDFNCCPDAPEFAPLREHFQEACACCNVQGEARFTFPSGPLGARTADGWRGAIDYVWASRDLEIISARVVLDESKASDHQPLVVEVNSEQ